MALSTVAIYTTTIAGGAGGGDPGLANAWVDTDGGTCSWSSSEVAYSDAAACGTLNAAYDAANANSQASTIRVKAGTYSTQTVTGDRTGPNRIIFDEADGESVTIQEIESGSSDSDGPDYVTYQNFKLDGGFTSHGDTTHNTLDAIDGGVFSIWGGSDYVITNGDWGPCASISSPTFAAGKCSAQGGLNNASSEITSSISIPGAACSGSCEIDNLLIEDNVIHDHILYCGGQPECGGGEDHYECIRMDNGGTAGETTNMIVRRNHFFNCQLEAMTGTGQGDGTIYEHNWVNATEPTYMCDPFTTTCQGVDRAQTFSCGNSGSGTIIFRYNSAGNDGPIPDSSGGSCDTAATILSYGNVMDTIDGATCSAGVTYSYNVHVGGDGSSTCGGTGEVAMTGFPYVNSDSDSDADYHLASGSSAPNNLVPTSLACTGLSDWDSITRPIDSLCDAGADER